MKSKFLDCRIKLDLFHPGIDSCAPRMQSERSSKENGHVSSVILPTCRVVKKMFGFLDFWKQGFPVLCNKRVKGFKERDTVQNVWEKIAENLDFVENSNFIRGNTEAVVRCCSGVNCQKNIHGGVLLL